MAPIAQSGPFWAQKCCFLARNHFFVASLKKSYIVLYGIALYRIKFLCCGKLWDISSKKTAYGQINNRHWPNMSFLGQKGHFWAPLGPPGDIFGGSKWFKLTPLDVSNNVQPCSTNVQPIWACWDCLWPNMAISGQKRAIFGHKNGLNH